MRAERASWCSADQSRTGDRRRAPDQIDELDHCAMTPEQIGLYQAVLDKLVTKTDEATGEAPRKGQIRAVITVKQICNHPSAYKRDDRPLRTIRQARAPRGDRRRGLAAGERALIFTHFASGASASPSTSPRALNRSRSYHGGLAHARPAHRRLPGGDGPAPWLS